MTDELANIIKAYSLGTIDSLDKTAMVNESRDQRLRFVLEACAFEWARGMGSRPGIGDLFHSKESSAVQAMDLADGKRR